MLHRRMQNSLTLFHAVLVLGVALSSNAMGYGPGVQSPTPSPCLADGVCQPSRESWGYSQTRWRPWPGTSRQPTVEEAEEAEEGVQLEPFERPQPAQEDLRGPAKVDKPAKSDDNAPVDDETGEKTEPLQELPLDEILPEVDPQGSLQVLPPRKSAVVPLLGDAPPALPESLRRVSLVLRSGRTPGRK